jgi:acyl-CoA synthetase (AMP-forming)/AMP-acid ligase II
MLSWLDFRLNASLWDDIAAAADHYRARIAVQSGDERWSYGDLVWEARRIRDWLEAEVETGPILFAPANLPRWVALILGAIGSGRIPVLADPAWTPHELEAILRRCRIRAVIREAAFPDRFARMDLRSRYASFELLDTHLRNEGEWAMPHGTAFGRFTSGTTDLPRCLAFSDAAALGAAHDWRTAARLSVADRVLCMATLSNGLAFNTSLFAVLLTGATLAFHPGRLLPRALAQTFETTQPTVIVGFPFLFGQLVQARGRVALPPTVRLAVSSAAQLGSGIQEAWRERMGFSICDYYGVAEVGPCTFNDGDGTSVGRPLAGVSIRITDDEGRALPPGREGRIRVTTRSMALGFLDGESPSLADDVDADGYYVTKDLGVLLPSGNLALRGRVGSLVNVAGRKIEPREVENVLRTMAGVRDVIVRGETAGAATILAAHVESDVVTREAIVEYCRPRLAQYKIPQLIRVVERLPRSSSGKASVGRMLAQAGGTHEET